MNNRIAVTAVVALLAAGAAAAATPDGTLDLETALLRGIAANTPARLAGEGVNLAQAQEDSAMAPLLPQLRADAYQSRRTTNLRAQGIQFPGAPVRSGPFDTFDARLVLSQTLFDAAHWQSARGAEVGTAVARAQRAAAEDEAATHAARAYINVLQREQAVAAAGSDLGVAETLQRLATDQRDAGVASGVDVARASTSVAQERSALVRAQAALAQAQITLRRIVALPQDTVLSLTDSLDYRAEPLPEPAAAVRKALDQRHERTALTERIRQLELEHAAARAQRLPTVGLFADYGNSANTPGENDEVTYTYGAKLSLPLLAGGAIGAGVSAASSRLTQARMQLEDLDAAIEQDVRVALALAHSAAEQVDAAQATRDFALRELELARNRFAQGLTSNVEVVQAQAVLAEARAGFVDALAGWHTARANLAASLGEARRFTLPHRADGVTPSAASPPESQP